MGSLFSDIKKWHMLQSAVMTSDSCTTPVCLEMILKITSTALFLEWDIVRWFSIIYFFCILPFASYGVTIQTKKSQYTSWYVPCHKRFQGLDMLPWIKNIQTFFSKDFKCRLWAKKRQQSLPHASIKVTRYHETYVRISLISKIQLVVYYKCGVLIGWATTRLYVIAY